MDGLTVVLIRPNYNGKQETQKRELIAEPPIFHLQRNNTSIPKDTVRCLDVACISWVFIIINILDIIKHIQAKIWAAALLIS